MNVFGGVPSGGVKSVQRGEVVPFVNNSVVINAVEPEKCILIVRAAMSNNSLGTNVEISVRNVVIVSELITFDVTMSGSNAVIEHSESIRGTVDRLSWELIEYA